MELIETIILAFIGALFVAAYNFIKKQSQEDMNDINCQIEQSSDSHDLLFTVGHFFFFMVENGFKRKWMECGEDLVKNNLIALIEAEIHYYNKSDDSTSEEWIKYRSITSKEVHQSLLQAIN